MWEEIDQNTARLKVPGGWVLRSTLRYGTAPAVHQIFVADENHEWQPQEEEE